MANKSARVTRFHANTLHAIAKMTGAAGLGHPSEFLPHHLIMRESDRDIVTGQEIWPYLPNGFLLNEDEDKFGYLYRWKRSRAESYEPFDTDTFDQKSTAT